MARQNEEEWQKAYAAVQLEKNPKKQIQLCEHARRLVQEKQVEIAAAGRPPDEALDEALRTLWALQEKARKSEE
jgi:hypothetical protein